MAYKAKLDRLPDEWAIDKFNWVHFKPDNGFCTYRFNAIWVFNGDVYREQMEANSSTEFYKHLVSLFKHYNTPRNKNYLIRRYIDQIQL